MNQDLIIREDNICPVTKQPCDDECCPPGATCNLSNDGFTIQPASTFLALNDKPGEEKPQIETALEKMTDAELQEHADVCLDTLDYSSRILFTEVLKRWINE